MRKVISLAVAVLFVVTCLSFVGVRGRTSLFALTTTLKHILLWKFPCKNGSELA